MNKDNIENTGNRRDTILDKLKWDTVLRWIFIALALYFSLALIRVYTPSHNNEESIRDLYAFVKLMLGGGATVFSIFTALNIWNASEAKKTLEDFKTQARSLYEEEKKKAFRDFAKLASVRKEQLELVNKIANLDEPFIRQKLSIGNKQLLVQYVHNVEKMEQEDPDILTDYDYEQAA